MTADLRTYLLGLPHLAKGLGTTAEPCSIAALNLHLTGTLTDEIPACMSEVIGRWVIVVQDAMPAEIRDSPAWREALADAAGTGRGHERERLALILDWMWGTVLPSVQPVADEHGFGDEWRTMCEERTASAAKSAAWFAKSAAKSAAWSAASAAWFAASAAKSAAWSAESAARSAESAAKSAAWSAESAARSAAWFAESAAWDDFDPAGLLARLAEVGR